MALFSDSERLMTPPKWTGVDESLPVVFLAGPIQGAQDYQTPLARRLIAKHPNLFVASPRRLELDEKFDYDEQVFWEQANLGRAAFNGVSAFWLAAQDHSLPYEANRSYAQTTRFEFGQVIGRKTENPAIKIQLGIDPEYGVNGGGSERYFRYLARQADILVHSSLDSLEEAILADLA